MFYNLVLLCRKSGFNIAQEGLGSTRGSLAAKIVFLFSLLCLLFADKIGSWLLVVSLTRSTLHEEENRIISYLLSFKQTELVMYQMSIMYLLVYDKAVKQ